MIRLRPHYRFRLPPARGTSWPAAVQSALIHAVLLLAAVKATAIAARELHEEITQRIAYLPPPDRRANSERVIEHLQYVDLGGGIQAAIAAKVSPNQLQLHAGPRPDEKPGGDLGKNPITISSSIARYSPDSIFSEIEVEERATRMPGSGAPVYPPELMRQRIEGAVLARFVVDTSGRAEPTSIQILHSTNEQFTASVKTAIPQMIFMPATVARRSVRQAVEQNFRFRLPPQPAAPQARPT